MKRGKIPGASIAVVRGDKVVFAKGYGVRDLVKNKEVDPSTIFQVGSTSKAFTAALIGMLVEEKKLSFDGKVAEYMPEFELFDPYVSREVTLRDLLSHRTGMPNMGWLWYASPFHSQEILHRLRYQPPNSSFRSKWEYQNCMFLAAGECSAKVAGSDWHTLLRKRLFKPLSMKSSSSTYEKLMKAKNLAYPHAYLDGKLTVVPHRNLDNIAPAGSINSNVLDMANWLQMLLHDGNFEGEQLLKKETIKQMHTIQMPFSLPDEVDKVLPGANKFMGYGLGWVIQDFKGKKMIWHNGGIDGMRSFVGLVPESDLAVVVLTNSSYLDDGAAIIGYGLIDDILALKSGWPDTMIQLQEKRLTKLKEADLKHEKERKKGTTSSLIKSCYTGDYTNPVYGELKIILIDNKLSMESGPLRKAALKHWNYDTFKAIWSDRNIDDVFLTFKLDCDGNVSSVNLEGLGSFAKKKADSKKPD